MISVMQSHFCTIVQQKSPFKRASQTCIFHSFRPFSCITFKHPLPLFKSTIITNWSHCLYNKHSVGSLWWPLRNNWDKHNFSRNLHWDACYIMLEGHWLNNKTRPLRFQLKITSVSLFLPNSLWHVLLCVCLFVNLLLI